MSRLLLALAILLPAQDSKPSGLTVERRVRLKSWDLVNKESEIHRREIVKIAGGNVAIEDVTFGTRLIIRTDRKLVWFIDAPAGTCSELTFDAITERRRKVLAELEGARKRVAGTQDAQDIERILIGLGTYPAPPTVEIKDPGKTDTVAGRACVSREILVNGTDKPIEVLVDPSVQEGASYFEALAAIGGFHPEVAGKLKTSGGFPMKGTVRYALLLDRVKADEEVTAATRGEIPAADFEPPANVKRVPHRGFEADAGPKPEKPKDFERSFREDDIDRENNPLRDRPPEKKEEKPK